ncbi:MAG: fibronectin/fibrinogen-binding protein [Clostridiales bacterium]|nr:fibronectin/fibrinogen-binding protein [Clostridiales bacterium]
MALDGLTLGFLAREINALLEGARVDKISQPDEDLLVMHLRNKGQSHRLLVCATPGYTRLHLTQKAYENPAQAPMFCMLARKRLLGGRFLGIKQLYGDRLLHITFSSLDELGDPRETHLFFEAMGKHSNLTMVQDGKILDALRHVTLDMSRVRQMLPGLPFVMPPRQDKLILDEATQEDLLQRMQAFDGPAHRFLFHHIAGLGAHSAQELAYRLTGDAEAMLGSLDRAAISQKLYRLARDMADMADPHLLLNAEGTPKEALPFAFLSQPAAMQTRYDSLSQAVETLYFEQDLRNRFAQRATGLRRTLSQALERGEKKLAMLEEDILSPEQAEDLRVMGELLTANMHLVDKGAENVALHDYYTGQPRVIALDKTLTPAQNAQRFFKRYRKAHTARKLAGEQKEKAQSEIKQLEEALYFLEDATTSQEISEIRAGLSEAGLVRREKAAQKGRKKPAISQPMRFISPEGFQIAVGKSSAQNEELLRAARGEDLWLHAKDIPGSHVLVNTQGKKVPQTTLVLAAKLAAFHSKARGRQTQVDYTLRKNVRKTPGGGPGLVHYTGEKSLLVGMEEAELAGIPRAEQQ